MMSVQPKVTVSEESARHIMRLARGEGWVVPKVTEMFTTPFIVPEPQSETHMMYYRLCVHQHEIYDDVIGMRRIVMCEDDPDESNRHQSPWYLNFSVMDVPGNGKVVTLSDGSMLRIVRCKVCYHKYVHPRHRCQ